jgi:penicillin G amidase
VKALRLIISLLMTLLLIYVFNRSLPLDGKSIPPLGKFLDPFHGFWQNSFENKLNQALDLEGLADNVSVYTDSLGIPHIFAMNESDLSFAQGYITARDRLWQLEFQTHAAAGRISEILGEGPDEAILDFDRSQRRIGMVMAANNFIEATEADQEIFSLIGKYSDGINQYINSIDYEDFPVEYKLLDYQPEPWTNLKAGLLLKSMAKTLNIGDKDIEMTNALKLMGKDMIEILFPDRDESGEPIVDRTGKWGFEPIKLDSVATAVPKEYLELKQTVRKPDENTGSNNWAVSGSKTASGSPILCNDPHLNLSFPSIWYSIHLNCPSINVMGVSLPGAPAVIIGFNDSIAWGVTNAQRDLVDWYKITFKDNSRNEYWSDGQWRKTTKVVEQFKVKGRDIFYDTIVYTHHGPITYDRNFKNENERSQLAFRWVSHNGAGEPRTFYLLNKAKNHSDYMNALDYYQSPAQNFVFASVSGDIAMRIQGKFPVRRKNEGRFVLDGTNTSTEWKAFIPSSHSVQDKNPVRGFVSSANQYHADKTYPYYITATSYESYRNRRINQQLASMSNLAPEDLMALQNDNYSIKASEFLPTLLEVIAKVNLTDAELNAQKVLSGWNFFNDGKAPAPIYFEAWWRALYPLLWDELENPKMELPSPTAFNTIKIIKEAKPDFPYFDNASTLEKETREQIISQSFSEAVANVEKWKAENKKPFEWAYFKDTYIEHLTRLEPFSKHILNGGNRESLNATTRRNGPSWRMVVSLEKSGVKAWGVYPGGQSGNPGSRFYDNFIDHWAAGRYFELNFSALRESYAAHSAVTTLSPKK